MSEAKSPEREKPRKNPAALIVAGLWMAFVVSQSFVKSDEFFALTVWPAWVLLLPCLLPLLFRNQPRMVLAAAWIIALLVSSEEPWSLARVLLPHVKGELRVVSLNCAGGSLDAAREVLALKPDIILFQESPSKPELMKLAQEAFGGSGQVVWGPDASIVAKGSLTAKELPRGTSNYVSAEWKNGAGRSLNVLSLRLQPPVLRFDLYNPSAWTDFTSNRRTRGAELRQIWEENSAYPTDILGGDFNTPAERQGAGKHLVKLKDSFAEQGRGYGATCVNPQPCLVRIDQIWRSNELRTVNSFVVKTRNSDHRMVVSDFAWVK